MLLLRIADINLLFNPDLKERFIKIGHNYRDFAFRDPIRVQNNHIDCALSVEEHSQPFNIRGKEVFSHTGPWRIYRTEDGYEIAFFSPTSAPVYYMLAELNFDFSRCRLYVRYRNKKTFIVSHPLDQLLVINLLSRDRGLMVHSCCINDNGKGFLYAGTSRSGKSTTARLWLKQTNPPSPPSSKGGQRGIMTGVTVLSDDRIIIRKKDGKFYAYGTPWHGEVNVSNPGRVEIEKIFFLNHSDKNYATPLSNMDAATRMFVRSFPTFWDKEGMAFTLKFIDEVVRKVPCYEFGFVPDRSAVEFVRGLR